MLDVGSNFFVIDPLHCLELNVAKTAFKYSFMDKMTDTIREKVTAYLAEIGCYLDLRAKGQRNPEQKWMTGATVDDYVLGKQRDEKSKSPGLAINTQAMCDLVYAPLAEAAADPAPAPPPQRNATSSRRRRQAPAGGYSAGSAVEADEATANEEQEIEGLLDALMGEAADVDGLTAFLRKRYGNRAANVLDVMRLWECYGELFSAWREEWAEDTKEYRAKRALRFLRGGIEFNKALNKVSNYKHQSWYVHYLVWVIPRQIYELGDTWRYSTCAIESRMPLHPTTPAQCTCTLADARTRAARARRWCTAEEDRPQGRLVAAAGNGCVQLHRSAHGFGEAARAALRKFALPTDDGAHRGDGVAVARHDVCLRAPRASAAQDADARVQDEVRACRRGVGERRHQHVADVAAGGGQATQLTMDKRAGAARVLAFALYVLRRKRAATPSHIYHVSCKDPSLNRFPVRYRALR